MNEQNTNGNESPAGIIPEVKTKGGPGPAKAYWSKFTPEERSQIMKDRAARGSDDKARKAAAKKEKVKVPTVSISTLIHAQGVNSSYLDELSCEICRLTRLLEAAEELYSLHLAERDFAAAKFANARNRLEMQLPAGMRVDICKI